MTIYTSHGAPVEIITAREVTVYITRIGAANGGLREIKWFYAEPKPRKNWTVEPTPVIHVTAKLVDHYPDGSGKIGEMVHDGREFPENELRADGGSREVGEVCRAIMAKVAA